MQLRADDPQYLLDYGFNEFKAFTLFKPGDTIQREATWLGDQPFVPLVVDQPVAVTLSLAERKGLKAVVKMPEAVKAPIAQGQEIGKLVISTPGLPDEEFPLKAGASVGRLGFFPRVAMAAHYMLGGRPEVPQDMADTPAADKPAEQAAAPKSPPPSSAARKAPPPSSAAPGDKPN